MLLIWVSLTWAGDLDLARAQAAGSEGRAADAFHHARAALDDQPDMEAWLTWLSACEVSGLADACRTEASMSADEDPMVALALAWHDIQVERVPREDVASAMPQITELDGGSWQDEVVPRLMAVSLADSAAADPDAAARRGLEIFAGDPTHPEILVPLFASDLPPRARLGKAKKKLLSSGAKALRNATIPELYRWHRVFVAAKDIDLATQSSDLLVEHGEPRLLERLPWTRAQTVRATQEMMSGEGAFPDVIPAEREAVALRLSEMLDSAGRQEERVAKLELARSRLDSVSMALAHADALLEAGSLERAYSVATEAMTMAVEPWPTDLAVHSRLARRQGVATALALRGEVALASGDLADAVVDLMVANQLALQPISTGPLEKAMAKGRYALEEVKLRLETRKLGASQVAIAAARQASESEDWAEVLVSATDAISVLCLPGHRGARLTATMAFTPELANAYALRALALSKSGKPAEALVNISTAVFLLPWDADPDWWRLKAQLHEASGQDEAAFFANAMAASTTDSPAKPWRGSVPIGEAAGGALVSAWMRGDEVESAEPRAKIERGRVIAFRAPTGGGGTGAARPVINQLFPSWSVTDDKGTVKHQAGRIEILAFFRTDSPSSLRMLDEVTSLAQDLRKQRGINVTLIGISMDPEQSALDAVAVRAEKWGTIKWDPALGARMGVSAFPTAWIVDSDGIARFKHVGYLGGSDYKAEVRFIAGI